MRRNTGKFTCEAGILVIGLLLATTAAAAVVQYQYDGLDRLISFTSDDGTRINYSYDPAGNIVLVWSGYSTETKGDLPDPKFLRVLAPAPNPFNARVVIHFEIRAAQNVEVVVFDLRGRVVRRLVDKTFLPGRVEAVWDGTNDNGANLASGLYLARVRSEHNSANLRMILLK